MGRPDDAIARVINVLVESGARPIPGADLMILLGRLKAPLDEGVRPFARI